MIFATRAVHYSANDVTERFSHFITERIRTIPRAGSEVILLYKFRFVGIYRGWYRDADPYDVHDFDDPDDFADEWADEFGDGDWEDGYDDAFEYWEENH